MQAAQPENIENTRQCYTLNGLRISSELPLPELSSDPHGFCAPQISIRMQKLPETASKEIENCHDNQATNQSYLMHIPGVAHYLISNGEEILVNPVSGSSKQEVRLFLLGSAFGVLLHQRGILPLHASAIKVDNRCIAFIGDSGAGKSTLAAFLHKKGYPVISDDVCAISFDENGMPLAWPGFPRLKLWSDALQSLQYNPETLVRDSVQEDKYHISLCDEAVSNPLPLTDIYELNENKNGQPNGIEPLQGQSAMRILLNNVYRAELLNTNQMRINIFQHCATIASSTNIFRFSREKGFDKMDKILLQLQTHWKRSKISSLMQ